MGSQSSGQSDSQDGEDAEHQTIHYFAFVDC